ncbi:MAG: hypothetical protein O2960_28705, partial [Verrucomicrobia bacterium]|nr:hypothetical protein [Verrucomicrobiota bacterium]
MSGLTLGNGRFEQSCYNPRLQPTAMRLGATPATTNCSGPGDLLNLGYTYGTSNNNGNLLTQTINAPLLPAALIQTYTYDGVNRLDFASEPSSWALDYGYDRYGNRWVTGS